MSTRLSLLLPLCRPYRMLSGQVGYSCTGAIVTLVLAALARELPISPFRLRLGS